MELINGTHYKFKIIFSSLRILQNRKFPSPPKLILYAKVNFLHGKTV